MSLVLLDPPRDPGEAVVRQLLEEGDEVRVIERDPRRADRWRDLGAHVALGDSGDAYFIEQAALEARTMILLEWEGNLAANTDLVVDAAVKAGVGRLLVAARKAKPSVVEVLAASDLDYVVLATGGGLLRKIDPQRLATAISAADDLAGNPRMIVDLGSKSGWAALGLEPTS